jgi:transcriptional regulator with XRE-family HTH domain
MQAKTVTSELLGYPGVMQTGRPSKRPRPAFGERLHELREQAGLSQQQLADKLGMSQAAYAWWERKPVALRPDQLQSLALALNLSVEELVGNTESKKRGAGPVGKMKKVFEAASQLPRNQQQQITAVVEAFLAKHKSEKAA